MVWNRNRIRPENTPELTVGVCRVHFLRNVLAQVPKGNAEMVAAAIRTIFARAAGRGAD